MIHTRRGALSRVVSKGLGIAAAVGLAGAALLLVWAAGGGGGGTVTVTPTGPTYVALGHSVQYTATCTCNDGCNIQFGDLSFLHLPTYSPPVGQSTNSRQVTGNTDATGKWYVSASCPGDGSHGNDSSELVIFNVTITTPSSFPAYVAKGKTLSLGSSVTPTEALGGSYQWTWSGPTGAVVTWNPGNNVANPTFSADTPGAYTVTVQYTKGGDTAQHSSGTIYVFDVSITTPAAFPAYVAKGDDLQLGCTVTPTAASGGSYKWTKASGPADVTFLASDDIADPKFHTGVPGVYTVKVEYTKDGSTADATSGNIYLVGVKNIQISANGTWYDVAGAPTEVLLKGTIYTFKAIPDPETAPQWPSGYPVWAGLATGTDPEKSATFDSEGDGKTLRATCGTSYKEATFDVIVPEVREMRFTMYDIYDKTDKWVKDGINDPACFKQGVPTTVEVRFYHAKNLTFDTGAQLRADVHFMDEYITGEDYDRTNVVFPAGTWNVYHPVNSEANAEAKVKDDYDVDMDWRYQVKAPAGTDEWISTGEANDLRYYLIWDNFLCPNDEFTDARISYSVDWGEGGSSAADASHKVMCNINGNISSSCICPGGGWSTAWDDSVWDNAIPGSGSAGMCCCRAHGMMLAAQVLGLGTYTHVYVNERPEPGSKTRSYFAYCSTCGDCWRSSWWGGFWNNWEGACRSGAAGSTCYAPAGEFEGTYAEIRTAFGPYYWSWGTRQSETCPHLAPP